MPSLPWSVPSHRSRKKENMESCNYCFVFKVGERQTVLVTEDSKDGAHFVGHNKFYDQVSYLDSLVCDWSVRFALFRFVTEC